jgi:hypothetical protein
MSRLDRQFAEYRAQAMRHPVTRANQEIIPEIEMPGGVLIGLSLNK